MIIKAKSFGDVTFDTSEIENMIVEIIPYEETTLLYAWKIYHKDYTDVFVKIPLEPAFSCIRDKIKPQEYGGIGARMADAYSACGSGIILPFAEILPAIKMNVYQKTDYDPIKRKNFYRPFGDWVAIACFYTILQYLVGAGETGIQGRVKIADGVYVPSLEEQACLQLSLFYNTTLIESYQNCGCGDILPAFGNAINCINESLRSTNKDMYYIMNDCYQMTLKPTPTTIDTGVDTGIDNKYESKLDTTTALWIGGVIIGGYFLMKGLNK
jgi:hypothetical protein